MPKISDLTAAGSVATADTLVVVQGGVTKKAAVSVLPAASGSAAGTMSAADKNKLDGIQTQGAAVAVAAAEIDWSAGSVFTKTTSGNITFTFANAASGKVIIVRVTAGGSHTVDWPTVKWASGTPPTQTASGTDVYTFVHDGTDIFGSVVQDMS